MDDFKWDIQKTNSNSTIKSDNSKIKTEYFCSLPLFNFRFELSSFSSFPSLIEPIDCRLLKQRKCQ